MEELFIISVVGLVATLLYICDRESSEILDHYDYTGSRITPDEEFYFKYKSGN